MESPNIVIVSEDLLRTIGNYTKKISLLILLKSTVFKNFSTRKSYIVYCIAIGISIFKIVFDKRQPYGSRNYIANLCGDKQFVIDGRKGISWNTFNRQFLTDNILKKSFKSGMNSIIYNLKNKSLFIYWTFIMLRKIYATGMKNISISKLFPETPKMFLLDQARMLGMLFSFGSMFWLVSWNLKKIMFSTTNKQDNKLVSKYYFFICIYMTACFATLIDNSKRFKTLACFALMSIFD